MITEWQQGAKGRPELFEMLDAISIDTKRAEKLALVQKFAQYSAFTDYLRCVFDDRVQFLLPEGKPPYTPAVEGAAPTSWHRQNRQLTYYVKGLKADHMQALRRETMFVQLLESVDPRDAVYLAEMIGKKTPAKGLTEKLVREALPKLLS